NRFCSSAFALVAERKAFRGRLFICAMASGSVLDGLRFQRFVADEDATGAAASTTEGRYGVPRHNGDPSRLNEWIFRARTLERKEATVTDEQKKLGPLTLRLIECFTGQALKIAQGLDMSKLEKADTGLDYLIDSLTDELRPRRLQQARELYEAGAQTGGRLARQPMDMGQYVLRRRAWYRALVDLNAELKLPDLNCWRNTLTYTNELHSILDIGRDMAEETKARGSLENPRFHAFAAGVESATDYQDDVAQETEDLSQPYEIGTFAEEHLPFLTDSGLDLEDPEACECAAQMVQLQEEAYYAGKQGSNGVMRIRTCRTVSNYNVAYHDDHYRSWVIAAALIHLHTLERLTGGVVLGVLGGVPWVLHQHMSPLMESALHDLVHPLDDRLPLLPRHRDLVARFPGEYRFVHEVHGVQTGAKEMA
ncbi:unnamed protein product, partial [Symbiodinium necroappetens]